MTMESDTEQRSALVLTEDEWEALAVIAIGYQEWVPGAGRESLDLCNRILEQP